MYLGGTDLKDFALDNFDLVKAQHKEDYLQLYRNYREFYMSERNFMLTSSALFIAFVFHRLCATIAKLNDLENEIEEGKLKPVAKEKSETDKKGDKVKSAWGMIVRYFIHTKKYGSLGFVFCSLSKRLLSTFLKQIL